MCKIVKVLVVTPGVVASGSDGPELPLKSIRKYKVKHLTLPPDIGYINV